MKRIIDDRFRAELIELGRLRRQYRALMERRFARAFKLGFLAGLYTDDDYLTNKGGSDGANG